MLTLKKRTVLVGFVAASMATVMGAHAQQDEAWYTVDDVQAGLDPVHVQRTPYVEVAGISSLKVEKVDDEVGDPPALLNEIGLGALRAVAAQLSVNRQWLNVDTMNAFRAHDLWLDELFAGAPRQVSFGGESYRIVVEQVGPLWKKFNPEQDPFVVFLNHEVFDDLGEDRALAFQDGQETVIFSWDFERIPALAVTLEKTDAAKVEGVASFSQSIEAPIELGDYRLKTQRLEGRQRHWSNLDLTGGDLINFEAPAATCPPEVAPASCSGGRPVCNTTAGYTPYFVVSGIKIKTDHEGCCFKGNPEIELFPLRLDATSPVGGTTTPRTDLIFSGRTISDVAGRSRYLPDINDNNIWYTVTNGLAVFPTNSGMEWSSTLVEQDDETGVLKMKASRVNVTKLYKSVTTIINDSRQLDFFYLLNVFKALINIIGLFDDGDDLYQESIGVANSLFCTNGLGQPFPKIFTLVSQEWEMRGYYACINPTCTTSGGGGGGGGGGGCEQPFADEGLIICY